MRLVTARVKSFLIALIAVCVLLSGGCLARSRYRRTQARTLVSRFRAATPDERGELAEQIFGMGRPAIPAALPLLADQDWVMRWSGVRLLGGIGVHTPDSASAIAARLKDECWTVRRRAALALKALRVRDQRSLTALKEALADRSPHVRGAAALALGRLGGEEACEELVALFAREQRSDEVRIPVSLALKTIASDQVLPWAVRALGETAFEIRFSAGSVVDRHGGSLRGELLAAACGTSGGMARYRAAAPAAPQGCTIPAAVRPVRADS